MPVLTTDQELWLVPADVTFGMCAVRAHNPLRLSSLLFFQLFLFLTGGVLLFLF